MRVGPTSGRVAGTGETTRFELTPILGNPQFLKLFADAYVQGGRRFSSKKQIYADAVRRLASERRNAPGATARPEIGIPKDEAARRCIERFATRAFRRPVPQPA